MFSHFSRTPSFDGQTDRRTHDDSMYRASIASRGKMYRKRLSCRKGTALHCMRILRNSFLLLDYSRIHIAYVCSGVAYAGSFLYDGTEIWL